MHHKSFFSFAKLTSHMPAAAPTAHKVMNRLKEQMVKMLHHNSEDPLHGTTMLLSNTTALVRSYTIRTADGTMPKVKSV